MGLSGVVGSGIYMPNGARNQKGGTRGEPGENREESSLLLLSLTGEFLQQPRETSAELVPQPDMAVFQGCF